MSDERYCAHCDEDRGDLAICPDCEEPTTTRDDAAEAAYERQCEDFYGGGGPLPLIEQQRRACDQKHGRAW